MTHVIGIWCGGATIKNLLRKVHEVPCLKLVSKRIAIGPQYALIPWDTSLDWLEAEAKDMHLKVVRCAQDERLAMRDLVAFFNAEHGLIVRGDCVDIDEAEVRLALARLRNGFERYDSKRIRALRAVDWLGVSDTNEWPERVSAEDFARTRTATKIEDDTRQTRARAAGAPSALAP